MDFYYLQDNTNSQVIEKQNKMEVKKTRLRVDYKERK